MGCASASAVVQRPGAARAGVVVDGSVCNNKWLHSVFQRACPWVGRRRLPSTGRRPPLGTGRAAAPLARGRSVALRSRCRGAVVASRNGKNGNRETYTRLGGADHGRRGLHCAGDGSRRCRCRWRCRQLDGSARQDFVHPAAVRAEEALRIGVRLPLAGVVDPSISRSAAQRRVLGKRVRALRRYDGGRCVQGSADDGARVVGD
jgi:hypothetical protein